MANISQGVEDCLYLGNIDALRDWGHAKDYVKAQWLMLQQEQPEDFVIATGVQYSVRQFVEWSANALDMQIRWEGSGVNEIGYWMNPPSDFTWNIEGKEKALLKDCNDGLAVVKIDPSYFRPTEVETLLGNPAKAKAKLRWEPEITAQEMCEEMVFNDLEQAKKKALLSFNGY